VLWLIENYTTIANVENSYFINPYKSTESWFTLDCGYCFLLVNLNPKIMYQRKEN